MKKRNQFTGLLPLIFSVILLVTSCIQGAGSTRGKVTSKSGLTGGNGTGMTTGAGAVGDTTTTTDGALFSQKVELSHLVDPFDGTYKKKLTLPKNFKGNLYLAGLNVSSLSNKLVSVRFNFGTDKQSVTLNATIGRAPGIVPTTDIQVLMIDMNSKPFSKMRLGYDLYDYNDYSDSATAIKEIVTDGRDGGLYCRGLNLEDDPTFTALNNVSACSSATDKCLYAYAKVTDATLYTDQYINQKWYRLSSIPTRSQVWTESGGVRSPSADVMSTNVCLPDDNSKATGASSIYDLFGFNSDLTDQSSMFNGIYRGPYKSINDSDWRISNDAIYNPVTGIFQVRGDFYPATLSTDPGIQKASLYNGYRSLLFPRAGKILLSQGVSYLGSEAHNLALINNPSPQPPTVPAAVPRTNQRADSSGTTGYVDGCNLRVQNFDPATNEGISSCNVNASIEVFYMLDGKEVNITTDKTIKLQLIRPSLTFEGKEVLTTSFKRCESSTTCGSNECCFNSRCWSKDLVTQCVDATPIVGNQEIGANCASDFECSSLCCNSSTGSCSPHNANGTNPIYCNKGSGQQCVSKEFCQQVAVVTCKIIKSGLKADGTTACTLRCPAVMTYGDCKGGTCVPPTQPAVPAFDPNDCSKAE